MITRYIFTGYHTDEAMKPKENPEISQLSFFTYGEKIFMYFESENPSVDPDDVATENLKEFPDGKHWMRMSDIFHYAKPLSKEHWERKIPDKQKIMRIMYLKDDKISSYIFYHYRYQEEYPGDGDKYGIIGILGNMLAFYQEKPHELDPEATGTLQTRDTPYDNWDDVMETHFRLEPGETQPTWKFMKKL